MWMIPGSAICLSNLDVGGDDSWGASQTTGNGMWNNSNQSPAPHSRVILPQRPALVPFEPATDWVSIGDWEEPSSKKPLPTQTAHMAVPLTKEEKAAEMARRKEERKQVCITLLEMDVLLIKHLHFQRIAQMKEQKRTNNK